MEYTKVSVVVLHLCTLHYTTINFFFFVTSGVGAKCHMNILKTKQNKKIMYEDENEDDDATRCIVSLCKKKVRNALWRKCVSTVGVDNGYDDQVKHCTNN